MGGGLARNYEKRIDPGASSVHRQGASFKTAPAERRGEEPSTWRIGMDHLGLGAESLLQEGHHLALRFHRVQDIRVAIKLTVDEDFR